MIFEQVACELCDIEYEILQGDVLEELEDWVVDKQLDISFNINCCLDRYNQKKIEYDALKKQEIKEFFRA